MTANTKKEAWEAADRFFPTDYIKDDASSLRAGYDIYRSTSEGNHSYICDLGSRLELNLDSGKTINIWIEQKRVYYIAKTYISQKGADVSVMCYQPNQWGTYFSTDFNDPHIKYFNSLEDAKCVAYGWANTDMTIHCRYIYMD